MSGSNGIGMRKQLGDWGDCRDGAAAALRVVPPPGDRIGGKGLDSLIPASASSSASSIRDQQDDRSPATAPTSTLPTPGSCEKSSHELFPAHYLCSQILCMYGFDTRVRRVHARAEPRGVRACVRACVGGREMSPVRSVPDLWADGAEWPTPCVPLFVSVRALVVVFWSRDRNTIRGQLPFTISRRCRCLYFYTCAVLENNEAAAR